MKRKTYHLTVSVFVSFVFLFLFFASINCYGQGVESETPDWLKRIDLGLEVGTDQKPYGYFETVQPLYQDFDKQHTVFIQPRVVYQADDGAYNLGIGYRRLLDDNNILLGTNAFFDFEDDDKHYRMGIGFEAFINVVECRFNTYIGLSPRRLVKQAGSLYEYEKAVDGFDYEFGGPLPYVNWIKLYGGGYWYNYEQFKNKEGWKIRAEIKPFKITTINFITYDDNKGDIGYRLDARMTIPFGMGGLEDKEPISNVGISKAAYPEKVDHSNRTLDRVEREHKIEVERYVTTVNAVIEVRRGS
ncbi:inverse autotransporter beta domain-containing protein [Thermoproteota archaeon]